MTGVLDSASGWVRGIPERYGRRTVILLALILVVGFALRADRVVNPIRTPGDDAAAYLDLSRSLYEDGTYGSPGFQNTSDWSPGAPLLYAASFYATGGVREGTVRILNTILGCLGILVVFGLGLRLGTRATGLLAAAAAAIYPPFIHTTGEILSEPPALFTLPAAVLAFLWADRRRSPAAWLLPGFLFGLTALIRPEYLAVGVAFAVLALAREWRRGGWRGGALATVLLLLAFLVPVLPWTVRNYVVLDRFVPLSTGGGKALYVGSYLPADGDYQRVKAILAERYLGRDLEPGSAALDRVNPVPLFNRVAAPLSRPPPGHRPGQDRQAEPPRRHHRASTRLRGDAGAEGRPDVGHRGRPGDGQPGRQGRSTAAAGARPGGLGAARLAPALGGDRLCDPDRDDHRDRRRQPRREPAQRDPHDAGDAARRIRRQRGGRLDPVPPGRDRQPSRPSSQRRLTRLGAQVGAQNAGWEPVPASAAPILHAPRPL